MAARRYSVVFYVAVIVALAATYAVYRVIESTKASSRIATAPVVVANRDIAQGERIDRLAVTVAQWPVSTVPVGAYGTVDSVAGRVARLDVFRGEPIVPGRLAPEGTAAGLETKITPGKRALGVRINDVSGVAGLIPPESRVDIVLTTTLPRTNERTTKIFMENMRVLAVAQQTQRTEDGRPIQATVATIEVTPEETEKLILAQAQGQIQLVLRGYGDPDSVSTSGATLSDLARQLRDAPAPRSVVHGPSRPAAPPPTKAAVETVTVQNTVVLPPPKPDSAKIEVIRGGQRQEVKAARDTLRRDSTTRRDTLSSRGRRN